jgi:uncharacterized protein (TIGR00266 family)
VNIEIRDQTAFASALVRLQPGEQFVSESGAMYRMSSNVDVDVTTKSKGQGGVLGGLKRMLAKESFFFSTYRVTDNQAGEVGLAPTHMGSIRQIDVTPDGGWLCTGGSYLGSGPDLQLDTQFQGLKGFVTGESLVFVTVHGTGPLLVSAFGRISEQEIDGSLIVDTGHVVAFTEGLSYSVDKVGGGWLETWLSGEGFVLRFSGRGRIVLQSHNPNEFGGRLGPKLPER